MFPCVNWGEEVCAGLLFFCVDSWEMHFCGEHEDFPMKHMLDGEEFHLRETIIANPFNRII